jgi:DNA-binding CsgD family transcriptional regulator
VVVTCARGCALTARQAEVLALAATGLKGSAIARRLGVSPRTVDTHLRNAYRALGAGSRTEAVVAAIRLGEIEWERDDFGRARPLARASGRESGREAMPAT